MSFNNKVVITGGSSGIGAATAILFAKEGAIVDKNESNYKKVAEEINKTGKEPFFINADVSKEEETRTVIDKAIEKFGKLDVLINNAAIIRYATIFEENLLETYDDVMNTNLRSAVLLTNLAAPYLVETKGNIVNISSVAGTSPMGGMDFQGFASYCTSKAGLDHFSKVAAVELAGKGIRVNVVSPGPVETEIIKRSGRESDWEGKAQKTALKKVSQPEEVAELVVYLASDKAKSITGGYYLIDCGVRLMF